MSNNQSRVVVVAIIVILIIISLVYYRSVERRRAQPEQPKIEQPTAKKEPQPKAPEPTPIVPEAPSAPVAEEVPVEPSVPPPAPPAPTAATCKPDSPQVIKQKVFAAPEGMVYVPAGAFTMGSPPQAGYADESPIRKVCLSGFYIDKYEVSNAQFKKFVDATSYVTDAEKSSQALTWRHPNGPDSNADAMLNDPVVCVSWNDANAYARWAGKRLPTEAEWEKAARGVDGRIYPWGNANPTGTLANIADKSAALKWSNTSIDDTHKTAAPVGSFPGGRSVYGVQDMAGNVAEWCYDWWNSGYYKTGPLQNPSGPQNGEFKVVRGGSWFSSAEGARSAERMYMKPESTSAATGFRCVKDAA